MEIKEFRINWMSVAGVMAQVILITSLLVLLIKDVI